MIIEPSWECFDSCKRCDAKAGQPCLDMRGVPKGWVPNRNIPEVVMMRHMRNPHPGRKKLPE